VINSKPQKTARPKGLGLFLYLELLIFYARKFYIDVSKTYTQVKFFPTAHGQKFSPPAQKIFACLPL